MQSETAERPGSRPAGKQGSRQSAVWTALAGALPSVVSAGQRPTVLDCGGGSGTFAVPLAARGADVTVVDVSADALATLQRRAEEASVGGAVYGIQGDVEALGDTIGDRQFDLVLAHEILEAVDDLPATFASIAEAVRAGGTLSVIVANPVAAVLGRALAGDPGAALAEFRGLTTSFGAVGSDTVRELCRAAGIQIQSRSGVGVFAEWVPGSALDAPGARETLDELEAEAAARAPFVDIASRIHLLARRPGGG